MQYRVRFTGIHHQVIQAMKTFHRLTLKLRGWFRGVVDFENALGFLAFAKNIQFQRNVAQFHKG
jgi:hypothetical protein